MPYRRRQDLELSRTSQHRSQAAAIADDIAYDTHDIDDGLRAGLFALDDLAGLPLAGDILREVDRQHPNLDAAGPTSFPRRPITRTIQDVIAEAQRRLLALAPQSTGDVRAASASVVAFSSAVADADQAIKEFLSPRMYRHARVMRIMTHAEDRLRELFVRYLERPHELPTEWRPAAAGTMLPCGRARSRISLPA